MEIETKEQQNRKQTGHTWLRAIIAILSLAALSALLVYLMKGSQTHSGEYPANVRRESLSCEIDNTAYPLIPSLSGENSSLRITAVFNGNVSLKSISLAYTVPFEDREAVESAENITHAEFAENLSDAGFKTTDLGNKFSRFDDRLMFSLYAENNQLTKASAPFFMLSESKTLPSNLQSFRKNYEAQGFKCQSTSEN